jgi:hypothetical protein
MFKDKSDPDSQLRFSVIQSKELRDAWEAPIGFDYNPKDGSTVVVSSGADKKAGTDDDLVCLNTSAAGTKMVGKCTSTTGLGVYPSTWTTLSQIFLIRTATS